MRRIHREGRRGLGELIAALVVAVALTSAAIAISALIHREAGLASTVALRAAERVRDSNFAPLLSVGLDNGSTLYLVVYPQYPINVSEIVYVKNGVVEEIKVGKVIETVSKLVVDPKYDCSPARIYLVTGSGAVIPYMPARDPRLLSLAYSGNSSILEKPYIDCSLLRAEASTGRSSAQASTASPIGVAVDGDSFYELESSDPPKIDVVDGDPYTISVIRVEATGALSSGGANLTYNITVLGSNEEALGVNVQAIRYSHPLDLKYAVSLKGDQGQRVDVYVFVYCGGSACLTGLLFRSGSPTIYTGKVYSNLTIQANLDQTECPLGENSYVAPSVIGGLSSYKTVVTATCTSTQWYTDYTLEGEIIDGSYATVGPLVLAYSTSISEGLKMWADVWLQSTMPIGGSSSIYQLPCRGPLKYRLVPYTVQGSDPLAQAITGLYNSVIEMDSPKIIVDFGSFNITRNITVSGGIIPFSGGEAYLVETPPYTGLPLVTALNISYKSKVVSSSEYHETIRYEWNITALYSPQPLLWPAPFLVQVDCLETGRKLVIAAPPASTLTLAEGGLEFQGIASTIGEVNVTLRMPSNSTEWRFYIIPLTGSIDEGFTASFTMEPRSAIGEGASVTLKLPVGTYLVIAAPRDPSVYPSSYAAIIVFAY
ncbi:MAG: hypothetical protein LRS46_03085 [Desulfurococcales archaeon]|nr:hypothetical protein [Desulfurococcales archaeon]